MPAPRNRRAPARDPADYTKVADEIVTAACQPKKKAATTNKAPQRATTAAVAAALIGGQLEETPPEPQRSPSPGPGPIQQPGAHISFTVVWSVLWKQKEIWPGTSTSDEFNYHDFNATTVKKVEAKAQKKGYRTTLQSAIATLTCHGPTKAIDAVCNEPR